MIETKQTVYETLDGKKFFTKKEAELHERDLKSTKLFKVICNPDTMEGRGYNKTLYFSVKSDFNNYQQLLLSAYCYEKFNGNVAWVMGVQPMENYIIYPCKIEETSGKEVKILDFRNMKQNNFKEVILKNL